MDDAGDNAHVRSARKVAKTKLETIDPLTGLNIHELTSLKSQAWYATEEGKAKRTEQTEKVRAAQNAIDPITGIKEAVRRAQITVQTKMNNIDEFGLNSFDRTHWHGGKGGFIDGLYYQSSNEKRFLELMKITGSIKHITRGTRIPYTIHNEDRTYLPDYILRDNILFEVKSKYTMFGPDNQFLKTNVAKLLAAKEAGYDVYAVIDDKVISLDDFIRSISDFLE